MSTFLGIDVGTSSVKAVLIDEEQNLVGSASSALTVSRPRAGFSEQNPRDWWKATDDVVQQLRKRKRRRFEAIAGIGLSGQMHGATLLDAADRPLRPAILWNDGRAHEECRELEASEPRLRDITGNIAMPGFTAPKLLWVRKHEPENFTAIAKVLLPKDYVRLLLSGDYASEMSDASGTLWLDVRHRRWSPELLEATGLGIDDMPKLHEGSAATGELSEDLKKKWQLASRPVIAGGGGDNAAAACGIGAVGNGDSFISIGTSGVLFVATDRFSPNTSNAVHAFCHALPGSWNQMGVILSATASLEWLAGILKQPAPELTGALGETLKGPSAVLFLPYLSGERTPVNDATVRGAFHGLGHESDRKVLTHAVLDGVAFGFRDCLDALKAAGSTISRATAVGGGSNSRLWLKIIATTLGITIDVPADGDFGAAFGAARLGLLAATKAKPADVLTRPRMARRVEPDRKAQAAYEDRYQQYRLLYPAMKKVQSQ
jgi:xylulokinase